MFSSPKTCKPGQKFCYTEQFSISVNYLHISVEEDGGLISDDTNTHPSSVSLSWKILQ